MNINEKKEFLMSKLDDSISTCQEEKRMFLNILKKFLWKNNNDVSIEIQIMKKCDDGVYNIRLASFVNNLVEKFDVKYNSILIFNGHSFVTSFSIPSIENVYIEKYCVGSYKECYLVTFLYNNLIYKMKIKNR